MESIGASLGYHLDLAPGRSGEVRRLVAGPDLELLDALDRGRHHARWRASGGSSTGVAVARRIGPLIAVHVVAIVAAVELETVLVLIGSGRIPKRRHTYLQRGQCRGITSQVGKILQRIARNSRPNRGVRRLEFGARDRSDFDDCRCLADLQCDVDRQPHADLHLLRRKPRQCETFFGDDKVIRTGRNGRKRESPRFIRSRVCRRVRRDFSKLNVGAWYSRSRLVRHLSDNDTGGGILRPSPRRAEAQENKDAHRENFLRRSHARSSSSEEEWKFPSGFARTTPADMASAF